MIALASVRKWPRKATKLSKRATDAYAPIVDNRLRKDPGGGLLPGAARFSRDFTEQGNHDRRIHHNHIQESFNARTT
jgi:hypothetical protein